MLISGAYARSMFGPRLTRIFASRAHAMWWSAMVLVTAYCVAADPPARVAPAPEAAATAKAGKKPADPWAGMTEAASKQEQRLP